MFTQSSLFSQIDDLPISPYPGSKRKYLDLFLGHKRYDSMLSPFLGGGSLELACKAKKKYVADADKALYAQWSFILGWQWPEVLDCLRLWQARVADLSSTRGYFAYYRLPAKRRRKDADPESIAADFIQSMDRLWTQLLNAYSSTSDPLVLAATALAIRKLCFGGVIRQGKGSQLNVKWAADKIQPFINFQGTQPVIKGNWNLHSDAFDAISDFKANATGPAIAILDPPYWLPPTKGVRNQMTPAYYGHKPHTDDTFLLGVNALHEAAYCPQVKRIVYCNYFSSAMDRAVETVAAEQGFALEAINLGVLDSMNNGNGKSRANRLDFAWILHRD